MMAADSVKRQNFNVSVDEEAELNHLRETLGASSVKDAILRASRIVLTLAAEVKEGHKIYMTDRQGRETRFLLPDFESSAPKWKYLVERPDKWKRQLYIKGRRQTAANLWYDMIANKQSLEEAAVNWDLPLEAIQEILTYCEANRALIVKEADEEKRFLLAHGVRFEPEPRP
jgi:hypothetical protein